MTIDTNDIDDLHNLWQRQKTAMKAVPYRGDEVQAWGLAFAYVFFKLKDSLCDLLEIDPAEFNYGMKYEVLRRLEEGGYFR